MLGPGLSDGFSGLDGLSCRDSPHSGRGLLMTRAYCCDVECQICLKNAFFFFFLRARASLVCEGRPCLCYTLLSYEAWREAGGGGTLITVGSGEHPSSRPCLGGLSINPTSTSAIPYPLPPSAVGSFVLGMGRSIY